MPGQFAKTNPPKKKAAHYYTNQAHLKAYKATHEDLQLKRFAEVYPLIDGYKRLLMHNLRNLLRGRYGTIRAGCSAAREYGIYVTDCMLQPGSKSFGHVNYWVLMAHFLGCEFWELICDPLPGSKINEILKRRPELNNQYKRYKRPKRGRKPVIVSTQV